MSAKTVVSSHLEYRGGGSDKVYNAWIEEAIPGTSYHVNASYGRRGSTLNSATKTGSGPVPMLKAQRIYDQLVKSKIAKGYVSVGGTAPAGGGMATSVHGAGLKEVIMTPQLLNVIEEEELDEYLNNNDWFAQEKMDGERRIISKKGSTLLTINRKGYVVPFPDIFEEFLLVKEDFVLDCEIIGDQLHVFDILERGGIDLKPRAFLVRTKQLTDFFLDHPRLDFIHQVEIHNMKKGKTELIEYLQKNNREGVVFKNKHAAYESGRPSSGGNAMKFKFWATASFIVSSMRDKRSVGLSLIDGSGAQVSAGNVSIPVNHKIPKLQDVVEVRYLYVHSGSLAPYQPVYLGVRTDVEKSECLINQLKFKAEPV